MANDPDFPFSFGNVSGDEEDGLFVDKTAAKKRDATKNKEEPYQAQIETDGWLLQYLENPAELMYQKNGANKVKMLSEYLYLHRRYEEAYQVACVYYEVVKNNNTPPTSGATTAVTTNTHSERAFKITDSRDLQEMMARAALKLGRAEKAAQIVDEMISPDAGFVFLKATVYKAAKRYNEAVHCLVDFQKTRSSNYAIWRQIAECLHSYQEEEEHVSSRSSASTSFPPSHSETVLTLGLTSALALISISRSRFLMEAASWPKAGFGLARYLRELESIKNLQFRIEETMAPGMREADKDVYDRIIEAPIEAWRSALTPSSDDIQRDHLDCSVVDYIWETWVQTLKGDGTGAVKLEDAEDGDVVVKAVRDM